jgi:hypothetical protein
VFRLSHVVLLLTIHDITVHSLVIARRRDGLPELGVASRWATDVVELLGVVRPMVLGAAHETVPAALPVGGVRRKKLQ